MRTRVTHVLLICKCTRCAFTEVTCILSVNTEFQCCEVQNLIQFFRRNAMHNFKSHITYSVLVRFSSLLRVIWYNAERMKCLSESSTSFLLQIFFVDALNFFSCWINWHIFTAFQLRQICLYETLKRLHRLFNFLSANGHLINRHRTLNTAINRRQFRFVP